MRLVVLFAWIAALVLAGCGKDKGGGDLDASTDNDSDTDTDTDTDSDTDADTDTDTDTDTDSDTDTDIDSGTDSDTDTDADAGPEGNYLWHTFYGTDAGSPNLTVPDSVVVDADGNIYVTGHSNELWNGPDGENPLHDFSGGYPDLFVLKLDATGSYLWHAFFGSSGWDLGASLAVDASGNVYVTGYATNPWNGPLDEAPIHAHSGYYDLLVIKLDSDGAYQWHTFYGASDEIDYGISVVVGGAGEIFLNGTSGESWGGPDGESPLDAFCGTANKNVFVLAMTTEGVYEWHTFLGNDGDEFAERMILGELGGLYLTGLATSLWNGPADEPPLHPFSGGENDAFVLNLSQIGEYQWHSFFGGDGSDHGSAVAFNDEGRIVTVGTSTSEWQGPSGESPFNSYSGSSTGETFVLMLSALGDYEWHTFYGTSAGINIGYGVASNGIGDLYFAGFSSGSWNGPGGESPYSAYAGDTDIFILDLTSDGEYRWHSFYGSGFGDAATHLALFGDTIVSTGYSDYSWLGPSAEDPLHAHSGGDGDLFVLALGI